MAERVYKLVFKTAARGFNAGEGASFSFEDSVVLVATGICRIDGSEPELEEAARQYKRPPANPLFLKPCVSTRKGGVGSCWGGPGSALGPLRVKF